MLGEHYESCCTVTLRGANSCSTTLINRWSSWPDFEKEGSAHNPDDPYTVESVRMALSELLKQLAVGEG
jgi:hypothetical protein